MKQFDLAVGSTSLTFDTNGLVTAAGAKVGTWTTNEKNQIVLTRTAGGSEALDVGWSFDALNRLSIKQKDKEVVTFARVGTELPMFRLDEKNRLLVNPDGDLVDGNFEFPLVCKYGLDKDTNLVVSINGVESVLQGFIADKASAFRFWFDDSVMGIAPSQLSFAGSWKRQEKGFENEIRLRFELADKALQLADKPFVLPEMATIDKDRNHLFVSYRTKKGVKELRFTGRLEFGKNNTLVFHVENANTPELKSTAITVEATFGWARGQGTVIFYVGKTENKTDKTRQLEIKGSLSATLGQGNKITWALNYEKSTSNSKQTAVKLATALAIETKDKKFIVIYERDGKKQRFEISAQMMTAKFNVSGGIAIIDDKGKPDGRQVTAFIGISW